MTLQLTENFISYLLKESTNESTNILEVCLKEEMKYHHRGLKIDRKSDTCLFQPNITSFLDEYPHFERAAESNIH